MRTKVFPGDNFLWRRRWDNKKRQKSINEIFPFLDQDGKEQQQTFMAQFMSLLQVWGHFLIYRDGFFFSFPLGFILLHKSMLRSCDEHYGTTFVFLHTTYNSKWTVSWFLKFKRTFRSFFFSSRVIQNNAFDGHVRFTFTSEFK